MNQRAFYHYRNLFILLALRQLLRCEKWVNVFALQKVKSALSTPKTRQQLLKITELPERTLRYNLSILKEQGLLKELPVWNDMRRKMFLVEQINVPLKKLK